jgi:hypothetical protein
VLAIEDGDERADALAARDAEPHAEPVRERVGRALLLGLPETEREGVADLNDVDVGGATEREAELVAPCCSEDDGANEIVPDVLIDALAGDALLLSDGVAELSVDSERIVDADTDADGDPECDEDSHDDADVVPPASDAEPVNDANDADAATVSLALMVGVAESPNAIEGVTVALSDTVTLCE